VNDLALQRSLGLVWRGDRTASPAARALREFLVEELRGNQVSMNTNAAEKERTS